MVPRLDQPLCIFGLFNLTIWRIEYLFGEGAVAYMGDRSRHQYRPILFNGDIDGAAGHRDGYLRATQA